MVRTRKTLQIGKHIDINKSLIEKLVKGKGARRSDQFGLFRGKETLPRE